MSFGPITKITIGPVFALGILVAGTYRGDYDTVPEITIQAEPASIKDGDWSDKETLRAIKAGEAYCQSHPKESRVRVFGQRPNDQDAMMTIACR